MARGPVRSAVPRGVPVLRSDLISFDIPSPADQITGMPSAAPTPVYPADLVLSAADLASYAADLEAENEAAHAQTVALTYHDHAGAADARRVRRAAEERCNDALRRVETALRDLRTVRSPGGVAVYHAPDDVQVTRLDGRVQRMGVGSAAAFLLDP